MIIRCPDCKHKWEYKGRLKTVWCASCGKKIKIEVQTKLKGGKKDGRKYNSNMSRV